MSLPNPPQATGEATPKRASWAAPFGLAVAFAAYDLFLVPIHLQQQALGLIGFGTIWAQPFLIAAWVALGPGALVYRLPISVATLIVWIFAQSIVELNLFAPESATNRLELEAAVVIVAIFAIAAAAIGLVRHASGIRISRWEPALSIGAAGRNQFGMRYLLGWMTVCALLIAIGRAMSSGFWRQGQSWQSQLTDLASGVAAILLLVMPPAVLSLIALIRPLTWRWLLVAGIAWPITLWAATEVIKAVSWGAPPSMGELAVAQCGVTIAAAFSALVLRFAGFHLTRR